MTEENLDVIRRGYEAFGRGDINALLESYDEHIIWVTPRPRELPTSGNRTGRGAVAQFFAAVNDVFEIQQFGPREFIAQGDAAPHGDRVPGVLRYRSRVAAMGAHAAAV